MLPSASRSLADFRLWPFRRWTARLWGKQGAVFVVLALGAGCTTESMDEMPLSAMGAPEAAAPSAPVASNVVVAAAAAPAVTVPAASVIGRGFAQVSGQPGGTLGERRLMAIRAARLEALRDLAEQVHGAGLSSQTVVRDSVVVDDEVRARLAVALRGARTVAIQPKGDDGYEVVMQLDAVSLGLVNRILRAGS